MRKILFYRTASGQNPIEDFLDQLPAKSAQKVTWVLKLVEDLDQVPSKYFKKLVNTQELWEIRASAGSNIFRLIGFFDGPKIVVVAHGFQKKDPKNTEKGHSNSSREKERIFQEENDMSDLQKYIKKRKARDPDFAEDYDPGYEQFRIGVILKKAREEAGLTQEELAKKLNTKKSAISRIENHAEDIKLSTLGKFVKAVGKELRLEVA